MVHEIGNVLNRADRHLRIRHPDIEFVLEQEHERLVLRHAREPLQGVAVAGFLNAI